MRSLVILLNAANSTDIERSEKLHTTECERPYSKRKKSLFIQIRLQSAVSSVTFWKYTVQAVPSKKKREGKERGGKEEKKKKGMERVCA